MGRRSNSTKARLANLHKVSGTNLERAAEDVKDSDGSHIIKSEDIVENVPAPLLAKGIRKRPIALTSDSNDRPMKKPRQVSTKNSSKPIPRPENVSSSRAEDNDMHGGRIVLHAVPQANVQYSLQHVSPAISSSVYPYYWATSNEGVMILAALRQQEAWTRILEQRNLELLASNAVQEVYNLQLRAQLEEQQNKIAWYEQILYPSSTVPLTVVGGVPVMTPTEPLHL